ncbi:MAG: 30S ribosomal protein S12 methylthiotransferase RimO [Acidimicrobiia bacterium]|nr:30S ribosomal protein S12 methylthiotransferase RimO [Acidimicrobiia bacterium]NNF87476.1 30S ribosomal protein S12 methylthiotransferase RimO [Acidimicrobiia bacterium]NNJ46461.1 30S ribosomal protein S12 methylthiotransferase RimO [Acidimicrobiia bacterium]NNL13298.1 30S ribosomal protein S12 methylthiotransferase RimO [Acidimicrobiia bacterium]NNL96946.1 30S ribosomal protein S12 methylthiotransferase RimO [Acidimicrobiia bacterium]
MTSDTRRVWLTTLGCAKNQVDSDKLSAVLEESGYTAASSIDEADVVMVNTCAFIEAAREESVDTIIDMETAKREDAKLVVLGCMAQRFGMQVTEAFPQADAVLGLDRYGELVGTLDRLTDWEPIRLTQSPMDILYTIRRPTLSTPYAYVKVAEGCDKPCTFCAIPLIRGKQRSRPPVNIREEMVELASAGAREVVLVAQDLAAYGRDIGAPGGIEDLLRFVSDVDGIEWIRLLYLYPREIRPGLIAEIAANPKLVPYFDLSLQHANGTLLRAMKRPGDGERHLSLIADIREAAPEAATRSSFIVGFPGETDDHVEELADFLQEARLDWAGFFPYSAEDGTPAAGLPGRVDPEVVSERLRYLMSIQEEITAEANEATVGKTYRVLVDGLEDGRPYGRSYREAPEIDGVIEFDTGKPGDFVSVEIDASYGSELAGTVVG